MKTVRLCLRASKKLVEGEDSVIRANWNWHVHCHSRIFMAFTQTSAQSDKKAQRVDWLTKRGLVDSAGLLVLCFCVLDIGVHLQVPFSCCSRCGCGVAWMWAKPRVAVRGLERHARGFNVFANPFARRRRFEILLLIASTSSDKVGLALSSNGAFIKTTFEIFCCRCP